MAALYKLIFIAPELSREFFDGGGEWSGGVMEWWSNGVVE
jgi:hypothetical protein